MTEMEYQRKRDNIARSEATVAAKAEAIMTLDEAYLKTRSLNVAIQQYEESKPELDKGDD